MKLEDKIILSTLLESKKKGADDFQKSYKALLYGRWTRKSKEEIEELITFIVAHPTEKDDLKINLLNAILQWNDTLPKDKRVSEAFLKNMEATVQDQIIEFTHNIKRINPKDEQIEAVQEKLAKLLENQDEPKQLGLLALSKIKRRLAPFGYKRMRKTKNVIQALKFTHDMLNKTFYRIQGNTITPLGVLIDINPKTSGANTKGQFTSVCKVKSNKNKTYQCMIKSGSNAKGAPKDIIAECIGSSMHKMATERYTSLGSQGAECYPVISPDKREVYLLSVFKKGGQDAFKIAGLKERQRFAGLRHRLDKKNRGLIAKVKARNAEKHTLERAIVSSLLQGDNDVHTGNFVEVNGEFCRIDHGWGGYHLNQQVIDPMTKFSAFIPELGKPTNHYWDFGSDFYESPHFLKALRDVKSSFTEENLRNEIGGSLSNIQKHFNAVDPSGKLAKLALLEYAKHLGMNTKSLEKKSDQELTSIVTDHYCNTMNARLKSLDQLHEKYLEKTICRMMRIKKLPNDIRPLKEVLQQAINTSEQPALMLDAISYSPSLGRFVSKSKNSPQELPQDSRPTSKAKYPHKKG